MEAGTPTRSQKHASFAALPLLDETPSQNLRHLPGNFARRSSTKNPQFKTDDQCHRTDKSRFVFEMEGSN